MPSFIDLMTKRAHILQQLLVNDVQLIERLDEVIEQTVLNNPAASRWVVTVKVSEENWRLIYTEVPEMCRRIADHYRLRDGWPAAKCVLCLLPTAANNPELNDATPNETNCLLTIDTIHLTLSAHEQVTQSAPLDSAENYPTLLMFHSTLEG